MHIIDGIFALTVLVGCAYGVIVGPFVAVFSILGVICAGPLLYFIHPYVFTYFPDYQNDLVAHLIYFPLGYLILIFSFKAVALKLDTLTKKLWPGGKRFWGGLVGSILACLFWVSIVVLSYPFVKELTQYSFGQSKLWKMTDSIFSKKPEYYTKLREIVSIDDFKRAMKSAKPMEIKKISNNLEISSGEMAKNDDPEDIDMEKVLSDQEESVAKQKMLYELLQKYLVKFTASTEASIESSH